MRALRRQDGIALPVVMAVIAMLMIASAVALSQATVGVTNSLEEARANQATQAAKAGLRTGIARQNGLGLDLRSVLSLSRQCIVGTGGALDFVPLGGEWCDAVTVDLGTGARTRYWTSGVVRTTGACEQFVLLACVRRAIQLDRKIVAEGEVDGVKRRVYAEINGGGKVPDGALGSLLGLLGSNLHLQLYKQVNGSFRECDGTISLADGAENPDSGC